VGKGRCLTRRSAGLTTFGLGTEQSAELSPWGILQCATHLPCSKYHPSVPEIFLLAFLRSQALPWHRVVFLQLRDHRAFLLLLEDGVCSSFNVDETSALC